MCRRCNQNDGSAAGILMAKRSVPDDVISYALYISSRSHIQ